MPNSWEHHQPTADATCIAPIIAPYGRYNVDEIIWASVPPFVLLTAWRMFFCYVLGPYLGGYVARRDHPDPAPKPAFLLNCDAQSNAAIATLRTFHARIEAKRALLPSKQTKKSKSTSDDRLTANIKLRNRGTKRKMLILPKGLSNKQSPANLAFLASLDSDATRAELPTVMAATKLSLSQIREYFHYERDALSMRGMERKFNEEAWKGLTMFAVTIYGIWV